MYIHLILGRGRMVLEGEVQFILKIIMIIFVKVLTIVLLEIDNI